MAARRAGMAEKTGHRHLKKNSESKSKTKMARRHRGCRGLEKEKAAAAASGEQAAAATPEMITETKRGTTDAGGRHSPSDMLQGHVPVELGDGHVPV